MLQVISLQQHFWQTFLKYTRGEKNAVTSATMIAKRTVRPSICSLSEISDVILLTETEYMKFKLILPSTFLVAAATTTASAVRMWHRIVEGWRESVPKKTDVVVIRNSMDDCSCWLLDGQTDERTDGWMNELTDNVYCRKVDMLTYVAYHRRTDRHTNGPAVPNQQTDGRTFGLSYRRIGGQQKRWLQVSSCCRCC